MRALSSTRPVEGDRDERAEMQADATLKAGEFRALALGAILILAEIALTTGAAYALLTALTFVLGLQPQVELPPLARLSGLVLIGAGAGLAVETLRYRPPRQMLVSTSVTLRKLFGRTPIGLGAGRVEPFSVVGPYRYVRNPLYLAVVLVVAGLGLLGSSALLLVWVAVLLGWFWFLLIPFEEKELQALFGKAYAGYQRRVPRLIPYRRRYDESNQRE